MRQFTRIWVMVVMVSTLLLALVVTSEGASALGRRTFRATDDNNRNFVTLESSGQLETLFALTSSLTLMTDLNLDSIQDAPRLEMTVDLSKLTTGFADRNSTVFSRTFLDLGAATNMSFRLTSFERSRSSALTNEQRLEVTGVGELTMGGKTANVVLNLFLTRLEQNEITKGRLPGDLLHMVGTVNFRLSDFGIRIPQEALLKLNDLVKIHFDAFATNQ
jgi:polyisoprenoid-binding protein YceI